MAVTIRKRYRIGWGNSSISQGRYLHNVLHPPGCQGFYDVCRARWGKDAPVFLNSGVAGETIATYTAAFAARMGAVNPDILVQDSTANDLGIAAATLDALWTKMTDPTQYPRRQLPRAVLWLSTLWAHDESAGGANQAQIVTDNALVATKCAANSAAFVDGVVFVDAWSDWFTVKRPQFNPGNATSGVFTLAGDGSHPNALGNAEILTANIMRAVQLVG